MRRSRPSASAGWRALGALAFVRVVGACNYDFDEFEGLSPPPDSAAPTHDGAAGAAGHDAAGGGAGRSGSAGASAGDAGKVDGADAGRGAGAGGTGSGGAGGSSGAAGSGGTGAVGGTTGSGGTSGSGGVGAGGAGGASDSGGAGATGGTAGSGGSTIDAGTGGSAGAGGTGTGGAGGTGATGGTGTGGTDTGGAGGAGTGGTGGGTTPPDAGARPDVRADTSSDSATPPFDCAAIGGRVYANHCYYAKSTPVTWDVAANQACPAPAHLVTITSDGEHTFVTSFLPNDSRWIGLHRPAGSPKTTAAFVWITGETSTYTHWYTSNGEPDYDGECVRLGPSNSWGDNPCGAAFPVVCERE